MCNCYCWEERAQACDLYVMDTGGVWADEGTSCFENGVPLKAGRFLMQDGWLRLKPIEAKSDFSFGMF